MAAHLGIRCTTCPCVEPSGVILRTDPPEGSRKGGEGSGDARCDRAPDLRALIEGPAPLSLLRDTAWTRRQIDVGRGPPWRGLHGGRRRFDLVRAHVRPRPAPLPRGTPSIADLRMTSAPHGGRM
jgi:hypothetical protein